MGRGNFVLVNIARRDMTHTKQGSKLWRCDILDVNHVWELISQLSARAHAEVSISIILTIILHKNWSLHNNMLDHLHNLELPATADMHVHLRDGPMMHAVVPEIRKGGVNTVLVMVRLQYA